MTDYSQNNLPFHAVQAQLFRWFTLYERPIIEKRVALQLDLLHEDIRINLFGKEVQGKHEYVHALHAYKGTENAHQLIGLTVMDKGKQLEAKAEVAFQSLKEDGTQSQLLLHYDVKFKHFDRIHLPLFSSIHISLVEELEPTPFVDRYPHNRACAHLHYWFYHLDTLTADLEPYTHCLAESCHLHLSEHVIIKNLSHLEDWLKSGKQMAKSSNHFFENIVVTSLPDDMIELKADLIWKGRSVYNSGLQLKAEYTWLLRDHWDQLLPKLENAETKILIPFSIV